tara:strand:- start:231004 stop:231891 length:888 start_codon:yes stop_codon:yes gene_type:complete
MSNRKINFGGGNTWFAEGWDVLDNAPVEYGKSWQYKGKCWDSNLPDDTYDIVFSSHMLEHVPHFRLEKTIAEFNRIMRVGGTLRILVPSLRHAAEAYVNNDVSYFSGSRHYSDHMGIGASFLRLLISPGGQTLAISREMDEILGGYAHLYAFDYKMLSTVLEKWGFEVKESEVGKSEVEELRDYQHVMCDGKRYEMDDPFVKKKGYLAKDVNGYASGFDKASKTQLVVEAKKKVSVPYTFEKQYQFNQNGQFDSPIDKIKLIIVRIVFRLVDFAYIVAKRVGLTKLVKWIIKSKV